MATINALMRRLREKGIKIQGSSQKRKLRQIGYYHSYKGFRRAGMSSGCLPLSDFKEIIDLHDFDMELKVILYERLMAIETALKNRVLEAVIDHSGSEYFDLIYSKSLTAYRCQSNNSNNRNDAWKRRLRLRRTIDGLIYDHCDDKLVIKHFRNQNKEIPIWALFEIMTLGNFAAFYNCLHDEVKSAICDDLRMTVRGFDSPTILKKMVFALNNLRNAVAHNEIVLDLRFQKDRGRVSRTVGRLLISEMDINQQIDFGEITDYILLITYLMKHLEFTKTECRQFIRAYREIINRYRNKLPYGIYSRFIGAGASVKLDAAKLYIKNT